MPLRSKPVRVDLLFCQRLRHLRVRVRKDLWDTIADSLPSKRSRKVFPLVMLVGVALFLFIPLAVRIPWDKKLRTWEHEPYLPNLIPENDLKEPEQNVEGAAAIHVAPQHIDNPSASLSFAGDRSEWLPVDPASAPAHLRKMPSALALEEPSHFAQTIAAPVTRLPQRWQPACQRKTYAGLMWQLNNTWLLDRKAMASPMLKYLPTFGVTYGVYGGYHLNSSWSGQVGAEMNLHTGQRYRNLDNYGRTIDLDYDEKSISLSYFQVPLLISYHSYRFTDIMALPLRLNLTAGLRYGRMLNYRVDGVKGILKGNDIMNRNDLALVAGVDWSFILSNETLFHLGFRTTVGMPVFSHRVPNYYELGHARNMNVGLHMAVDFGYCR